MFESKNGQNCWLKIYKQENLETSMWNWNCSNTSYNCYPTIVNLVARLCLFVISDNYFVTKHYCSSCAFVFGLSFYLHYFCPVRLVLGSSLQGQPATSHRGYSVSYEYFLGPNSKITYKSILQLKQRHIFHCFRYY